MSLRQLRGRGEESGLLTSAFNPCSVVGRNPLLASYTISCVPIDCRSPWILASRAILTLPPSFATANPRSNTMMITTSMISIMVKPALRERERAFIASLRDQLIVEMLPVVLELNLHRSDGDRFRLRM